MNTAERLQRASAAMNKLAKWRMVFAGWQLGTRAKGDPECDAVRDHREVTLLLRAEVTALTGLLLRRKAFSQDELADAMAEEAALLDHDHEHRFPGFKTTDHGIDIDVAVASQTMKGWRP